MDSRLKGDRRLFQQGNSISLSGKQEVILVTSTLGSLRIALLATATQGCTPLAFQAKYQIPFKNNPTSSTCV